jgi:Phosphotransferase enzyme family
VFNGCKQLLCTRAAEWGLPAGGEWNLLFHHNSHPTWPTMNLLWFYGKDQFPRVVTKICRRHSVLAQEFQSLEAVYSATPRYVPRPMHLGETDGFGMLWMEGVPGRRIPPGKRRASMVAASVDMLVSIHAAVNRGVDFSAEDRHARMVVTPLETAFQCGNPAVRKGCLALLEQATAEWLRAVPVIPQHGDLFIDNVLTYRDEYHIVDWDSFGDIDLPFHDLITLLLSFLEAYTIAPDRWSPDLRRQLPSLVGRYAGGLHLPTPLAGVLLPLALANQLYLHCRTIERRLPPEHARRAEMGAQAVPLVDFIKTFEGPRGAAAVMHAALEHYFEHAAFWQEAFLGK